MLTHDIIIAILSIFPSNSGIVSKRRLIYHDTFHAHMVAQSFYSVPKKVYPLIFDNNFGKCGPIFKILSPGDS